MHTVVRRRALASVISTAGYGRRFIGNAAEMAHFAELADSWWDPAGPQRILHKMNIMRLDFIREVLSQPSEAPGYNQNLLPPEVRAKLAAKNDHKCGLSILDVGCGGGLLSESLARWPETKSVQGTDVTPEVLKVARDHAKRDPALKGKLSYHDGGVESVTQSFDVVTMFEVVEHLDDPAATLGAALDRVRPGGYLFLSTINRTMLSWLTTIVAGEYLLKIVPKGTHTWSKYINESELRAWIDDQPGWSVVKSQGCLYVPPPVGEWQRFDGTTADLLGSGLNCIIGKSGGNYLMAARKI